MTLDRFYFGVRLLSTTLLVSSGLAVSFLTAGPIMYLSSVSTGLCVYTLWFMGRQP